MLDHPFKVYTFPFDKGLRIITFPPDKGVRGVKSLGNISPYPESYPHSDADYAPNVHSDRCLLQQWRVGSNRSRRGPQAARTALSTHNAFGRKCLAQNRATAGLNVETSGRLSSQTEKARLHTERLHALSVRERSAPQAVLRSNAICPCRCDLGITVIAPFSTEASSIASHTVTVLLGDRGQ